MTTAFVAWVVRHPWAVLLAALALTVASTGLAYQRLEYHTQRNDLLSADKPCQKRWQKYLDAFGDDDDMVVVAEGTDPERMKAALDAVAAAVRAHPDQFDRVFHRDEREIDQAEALHAYDVIKRSAIALQWRRGDLLLLDNTLAAHGRTPFSGTRSVLTALIRA